MKSKRKKCEVKIGEENEATTRIGIIRDVSGFNTKQDESKILRNNLFGRAIASAKKHGIKLIAGRKNDGDGNCSYQSVIFNINDRICFPEKLNMGHEFYRRIWNLDIKNKILDKSIPWNPGLTQQEIQEGFHEMMESGIYERDFFGDMMMAGIACGVRKLILVFNTHENTVHDPVSVVDPRDYGGGIDTDIPVVVCYNLVHYESVHPVDQLDIDETVRLVNSYTAGRYRHDYGFTRGDMQSLVQHEQEQCPKDSTVEQSAGQNDQSQPGSPPRKASKFTATSKKETTKKH